MEQTVRDFNSSGLVGESTACPVVVLVPLCVHARGGTDETSEYGIPTWDDVRRTCVEVPVGCAMCVTYYETYMYMFEGRGGGEQHFHILFCVPPPPPAVIPPAASTFVRLGLKSGHAHGDARLILKQM